jgi:hypothetical protein
MDVAGLRLVLEWADAAETDPGIAFHVIPGSPVVQRIFALTATAGRVSFLRIPARPVLRLHRSR